MSNWTMVIEGVGPHHTPGTADHDADVVLTETVAGLRAKGHNVTHASIVVGNAQAESRGATVDLTVPAKKAALAGEPEPATA
jgi:hypothetical protein